MASYTFQDLIDNVKCRPEIWQRSHPRFNNQSRRMSWTQISKELKTPEIRLRNSWKYLVDQLRRELKSNKHKLIKKQGPVKSKWAYYNQMSFMKDELLTSQRRRNIKNLPNSQIREKNKLHFHNALSNETKDREPRQDDSDSTNSNCSANDQNTDETIPLRVSTIRTSFHEDAKADVAGSLRSGQDVSKVDQILQKLDRLNTEINNEDLMFFLSLLPMMKTLSPVQRLQLRGKINDWMLQMMSAADPQIKGSPKPMEEQYEEEWCPHDEDTKEGVLFLTETSTGDDE